MLFLKSFRKKITTLLGLFSFILTFISEAIASSPQTATFQVTAQVTATCTISAANLAFGNYNFTANQDSVSNITVNCTSGTAYSVGLDAGTASGATVTTRKMTSGSNTLNYFLYSNTGRTNNFGNTAGTDAVSGTGNGSAQIIPVFGRIPSGQQSSPVGTYTDTITAKITF